MKKLLFCIIVILCLSCLMVPGSANSVRPPDLVVVVINAPKDVSVNLASGGETGKGHKQEFFGITYFTFYSGEEGITLEITGGGTAFTQPVGEEYIKDYESIVSLDFSNHTMTQGRFVQRSLFLAAINIIITFVVEGIVFLIFGFRRKKSWIAFFAINLVTQVFVNCVLYGSNLFLKSNYVTDLFFVEIIVVIVEIAAFLSILDEQKKDWRVAYVLTANVSSSILGYCLMSFLPL